MYYLTNIALIAGASTSLAVAVCVRLRFCFVVFFVRMWLLKACFLLTLPEPVSAKRFLAPEMVFILGIAIYF